MRDRISELQTQYWAVLSFSEERENIMITFNFAMT